MEKVTTIEAILLFICFSIFLINAALPIILFITGRVLSFWERLPLDYYKWAEWYQKKKYKEDNPWVYYLAIDLIAFGFLLLLLSFITKSGILLPIVITTIVILSGLFIPRFVIDISNALKYRYRTGKSETIEDLQDRIEELESKMEKEGGVDKQD